MPFKEGNDPFVKVIQPPDPIGHPVTMIRSNHSASEEFLQSVEELDVPLVLDNREFGEHLKLAGHFWMRIDADVETTLAVNKPYDPLSVELLRMRLNVKSLRVLHMEPSLRIVPVSAGF